MDEQQSPTAADTAGFRFALTCDRCGSESGSVEVRPPGELPEQAAAWSQDDRDDYLSRWPSTWRIIYRGMARGSGATGAPLSDPNEAAKLRGMFEPFDGPRVQRRFKDCGWCPGCEAVYCREHWYCPDDVMHCPRGHRFWVG